MRDAVYHQSLVLVMVGILKNNPVHGVRGMGTGERLPGRKVLKMLFMHVSGECERVREAPGSDVGRQTNIPRQNRYWVPGHCMG